MRVATKPRFAIVFLMFLALGLSVGLPAADVLETTYDESEAVPYEGTPLFSIAAPAVAARTTQNGLSCLHLKSGAPSLFAAARAHDTDANRSAEARPSLTLLCTLLC
jgi:hypothetical protein